MVQHLAEDYSVWSRIYLKKIDSDNEGVFIMLKVNGQLEERQINTSSVE